MAGHVTKQVQEQHMNILARLVSSVTQARPPRRSARFYRQLTRTFDRLEARTLMSALAWDENPQQMSEPAIEAAPAALAIVVQQMGDPPVAPDESSAAANPVGEMQASVHAGLMPGFASGAAHLSATRELGGSDEMILSSNESSAAALTVGSFANSTSMSIGGQSFTPSVTGPDGSGTVGDATTVTLSTISIGYASSTTSGRSTCCWVYSVMLDDQSQVGQSENLVALSTGYSDGSVFGSGSFSRTYSFSNESLSVSETYYIYFDFDQYLRCKSPSPYSGGNAWDADFSALPYDIQFQVTMFV